MSQNMLLQDNIAETPVQAVVERGIEFAAHQVRATIERDPGMMWLLWEHTGQPYWREQAEKYSRPLEPRQFDDRVHDLGFIFLTTYLPWVRASGSKPEAKQIQGVLIQAGRTLATRYKEKGKYLSSFLAPESIFIDIMMNVGIIFHSAGLNKDRRLREGAFTQ